MKSIIEDLLNLTKIETELSNKITKITSANKNICKFLVSLTKLLFGSIRKKVIEKLNNIRKIKK